MAFGDFRHCVSLRVRWAEVDQQGVVFNGHYLTYCDVCITEYWRAVGFAYPQDFVSNGVDLYVRKASVEYFGPALYDDELEVVGRIAALGRSSLTFVVEIYRRGALDALLVEAKLVYVNVEIAKRSPSALDAAFRDRVIGFERVKPSIRSTDAR